MCFSISIFHVKDVESCTISSCSYCYQVFILIIQKLLKVYVEPPISVTEKQQIVDLKASLSWPDQLLK